MNQPEGSVSVTVNRPPRGSVRVTVNKPQRSVGVTVNQPGGQSELL